MKRIVSVSEIKEILSPYISNKKIIGFVPTMGALHQGHLSLINRCKQECDITVCSIFVNPKQFNRRDDFEKYPVTLQEDMKLLSAAGCDILFNPDEKEMYPEEVNEHFDFGQIETVMEGKFRPGHFRGVAVVVKRLFDIVKPFRAYFGEKDYQQLAIIKKLTEDLSLGIEIVPCPIVRENDGLAMSSRNVRLSKEEREDAPYIYKVLQRAVEKKSELDPVQTKQWVCGQFEAVANMNLEYFEISDAKTLEPIDEWKVGQEVIACIAVFLGEVRLIDNIIFIS